MNKSDLVKEISHAADLTQKQADAALTAFVETITAALKNKDKVSLVGFGSFEVSERAARTGRNPKTGKEIKIPKTITPRFKAGKSLKEAVAVKSKK